jgi:hypothetical protein
MGCATSKTRPQGSLESGKASVAPAGDHKRAKRRASRGSLSSFDKRLEASVRRGTVKLLRVSWLVGRPAEWRLMCRQELEALEAAGEAPFLTPDEAVEHVHSAQRRLAALSYGWLTKGRPDPDGALLAIVRRHLEAHVEECAGLFWDFASLPQKPRTAAEDVIFADGLAVMGDVRTRPIRTSAPPRYPQPDAPVGWRRQPADVRALNPSCRLRSSTPRPSPPRSCESRRFRQGRRASTAS